ncbi:RagB/SusD family nutrient uptake outer membrane protein [Dyadobacter chenwenxiniae]|uniref:RagB/SusD family nutrient uptake outer membrane protein n=1 Tax=Dyadobacter chenwenxiniae TaxID=2906456 RepID=A0A9X1TG01_9BACT|nr:RagB/SusD family nutrient uptake outer membrane protein [Dyadobacter chenwenxiniae]MCF0063204.1 RagB/SusD family nutrient uptake outer membrane protein [Dyadobacter chenwenxiniae]UON85416.1 RagB/SusD family nutrient uptake outer membrane protein [Dyadobacter chenwenxiniae]
MKKTIIYLIMTLVFGACTDQLEQRPLTSKELGVFLKTETEVEEYVNSIYAALQNNGLYGLNLPAMGEIPSDNTFDEVPANDAAVFGDMDEFKTIPANGAVADNWRMSYVAIQRCNVVLARINDVTFKADITKNARIGEAKFIRALMYFNLVRFYGDVPLVLDETTDPNVFFGQGRANTLQVYEQIIKDLSESIPSLPASSSQPGRVIKTAAQALLGKVYLTQKEYQKAKTELDALIAPNAHALLPSVEDVFSLSNENNQEIIFAVQFASGINGNTEGSTMYQQFAPSGTVSGAKGHNLPTIELYNKYTQNDARKGAYVALTPSGVPFNNKLKKAEIITDGGSNVVVLRYADVLLMQAEIENELGNLASAQNLLNLVRKRAGLTNTASTTQSDLRAAIDLERRLELVGEGHRWLDLLRTGQAITVMNSWFTANNKPITVSAKNLVLPIPQNQIDTDPAIIQNPAY